MPDDRRHRRTRRVNIGEYPKKSPHRLRQRQQPHQYPGGNSESSLRAYESPPQIVPGTFPRQTAQIDHRAVLQRHFHADDMVSSRPVGQTMRPSGVLGNVPPDAARPLAGRIRRVPHPELARVVIQIQVNYPRLHQRRAVDRIHLQYPLHPRQDDLQPVRGGNSAATQPGAAPAPDHRNPGGVSQRQNPAHLIGTGRQHHRPRHRAIHRPVVLINQQILPVVDDIRIPHYRAQLPQQLPTLLLHHSKPSIPSLPILSRPCPFPELPTVIPAQAGI